MIQPTEPRQVTENLQAINAQLSEELKSLRAAQSREGPQAAMMAEAASTAEAAALATTAAEEAMQYAGTLQDARQNGIGMTMTTRYTWTPTTGRSCSNG